MRKVVLIALAAVMLLSALPLAARAESEDEFRYAYVTAERVNMRSEPAVTDSNVIDVLDQYTLMAVLGEEWAGGKMWLYVVLEDDSEGYIQADYLYVLSDDEIEALVNGETTLDTLDTSGYIGIVSVKKTGYINVRKSASSSSSVIYIAHYGERYLCERDAGNGWYAIRLVTGDTGYISSASSDTRLDRSDTKSKTLSTANSTFEIVTKEKTTAYSQPKTSAKSRRVSGGVETTFYFKKGTEKVCFGKTTRGGKDWYLCLDKTDDAYEPSWLPAGSCTVTSGNPDANIIPGSWYD